MEGSINILSVAVLDRMARDTGCSEHDDCLTCPLPKCIYDTKPSGRKVKQKHIVIRKMFEHMTAERVAEELGISVRTVQRALKEK